MKSVITLELRKVFAGLMCTMLTISILAIWRRYDNSSFLFIQICVVSLLSYFIFLILETKLKFFSGNSLVAALISFTLLTSLALNIDRSRSVQVVKWVHQISSISKVSVGEIAQIKHLSPNEIPPIKQRLREQTELGLLEAHGSLYSLSFSGRAFISLSEFLAHFLSLNGYLSE